MEKEKLRIDKYLWAIRLFKTRSLASEAIDKGRVKMGGVPVKASRAVAVNDVYEVKARKWVIRVTGLLGERKAYSEAIQFYRDETPPEELAAIQFAAASFQTGKRLSKIGRPTKKERRELGEFFDGTNLP
jgi:ribosome-associated heat shock protein Hsp15